MFPPLKSFITKILYHGKPMKIEFKARSIKIQGVDFLSLSDIDHHINKVTQALDVVDSTTHSKEYDNNASDR